MMTVQLPNWDEVMAKVDPMVIDKAVNSSIRKSLMKTRTQISKNVRKVYNVKAGDIGKVVTLKKVDSNPPTYVLKYFGYRISLRKYAAQSKRIMSTRGWRIGVTVKVRKDRGRKITGAFFGPGGYPAYVRKGKERIPIEKRTGLAIPQMVQTKNQLDLAYKKFGKEIGIIFPKQLTYYMGIAK